MPVKLQGENLCLFRGERCLFQGLNFHSSGGHSLVVTDGNLATFQGTGTVNGEDGYQYQIWAGDASPDTFRIKIWTDAGAVVYDNGSDQALGGGSIKVHTK